MGRESNEGLVLVHLSKLGLAKMGGRSKTKQCRVPAHFGLFLFLIVLF